MYPRLKERSSKPELMDDLRSGGEELHEALQQLRLLNRIFNAAGPTVHGVKRLWDKAGKPKQLDVLDIGCGSGDVNRILLQWADSEEIDMKIELIDITDEACAEAKALFDGEPRVTVSRGDVFHLEEQMADFVIAGQFIHHFSDEELPRVLMSMLRASRFGVAIQDIHRHVVAWMSVWLTTRLISKNRYIRHDGPLSVAKGFRTDDWVRLQHKLEKHCHMTYSWMPLFRYSLVLEKKEV